MGPLTGRRILVTRTRHQAAGLVDGLHALDATVVLVPLISTLPIATPAEIAATAAALQAAPPPRWVAFSSATAVRLVTAIAGAADLAGVEVAAVGPATAAAARDAGLTVALVAAGNDAEGLARALLDHGIRGAHVWLPGAEGGRDAVRRLLRAGGARVASQALYRSEMPAAAPKLLAAALARGVDAITLTSGSTARHLVRALGGSALPAGIAVACIGAPTAAAARAAGLEVDVVADEASADGLVAALARHLAQAQPLP